MLSACPPDPSDRAVVSTSPVLCIKSTLIRAVSCCIFQLMMLSMALLMPNAVRPISNPHAAVSTQRPTCNHKQSVRSIPGNRVVEHDTYGRARVAIELPLRELFVALPVELRVDLVVIQRLVRARVARAVVRRCAQERVPLPPGTGHADRGSLLAHRRALQLEADQPLVQLVVHGRARPAIVGHTGSADQALLQ